MIDSDSVELQKPSTPAAGIFIVGGVPYMRYIVLYNDWGDQMVVVPVAEAERTARAILDAIAEHKLKPKEIVQ